MVQTANTLDLEKLGKVIDEAKVVAKQYYELTGRPLGITGEIGEYEAIRLLDLNPAPVRQPGYDAVRKDGSKIQVKTRRILGASRSRGRMGTINLEKSWDAVVLVLLDEDYEPTDIYEAQRAKVEAALNAPGSRARNERRALGIRKFRSIAELVWSRPSGRIGSLYVQP